MDGVCLCGEGGRGGGVAVGMGRGWRVVVTAVEKVMGWW